MQSTLKGNVFSWFGINLIWYWEMRGGAGKHICWGAFICNGKSLPASLLCRERITCTSLGYFNAFFLLVTEPCLKCARHFAWIFQCILVDHGTVRKLTIRTRLAGVDIVDGRQGVASSGKHAAPASLSMRALHDCGGLSSSYALPDKSWTPL